MRAAAHRHYNDGRWLEDRRCYDNAGYHYGLSAECAIKSALVKVGVRGDHDAIWLHFPDFARHGLLAIETRGAANIRVLLQRPNFMQGWNIKMRYSSSGAVLRATAEKWRHDANDALGLLIS
jgi:hypothetical protein